MRFSQEFIDRVLESNNLVDVIGAYTQLKASGQGFMGRCPFPDHREKTPSFSVSELKQVYNCFGCHKKGNLLTFVMEMQGLNFPQAVEFLAHRASIPLPSSISGEGDLSRDKKKEILRANAAAAVFYRKRLLSQREDSPAKEYLRRRGLSPSIQEEYGIGWAGSAWDELLVELKAQGFPASVLEEARLIKSKRDSSGHYDLFRERILFPIRDTLGNVLGFGGRVVGAGEPKYLNSPESLVFHKARILYGTHLSAKFVRSQDQAIIVEGYMDHVALYAAGLKNVLATMGTALTLDHARNLKKMTSNVLVLFDGDSAGVQAAERSLPIFLQSGLFPRSLSLPDGMDPDDFLRAHGASALEACLQEAGDLLSRVLQHWLQDYRGENSQKIDILARFEALFEGVEDARIRRLSQEELAKKLGVELAWVQAQMRLSGSASGEVRTTSKPTETTARSVSGTGALVRPESPPPTDFVLAGAPPWELVILQLCLAEERFLQRWIEEDVQELFVAPGVSRLLQALKSMYGQNPQQFVKFLSSFTTRVDQAHLLMFPQHRRDLQEAGEFGEGERGEKVLLDAIRKLRLQALQRKANELSLVIQRGGDSALVSESMQRLVEIQKERRQLEFRKVEDNEIK